MRNCHALPSARSAPAAGSQAALQAAGGAVVGLQAQETVLHLLFAVGGHERALALAAQEYIERMAREKRAWRQMRDERDIKALQALGEL